MAGQFRMLWLLLCCTVFFSALESCAFRRISRHKDITYLPAADGKAAQTLNVFAPKRKGSGYPVLVYFYGGNWTSGRRSLYNFFGSRWARKGVVTVIPDYPKDPDAAYREMATDAATAVRWVQEHIARYGGDTGRIFVSGHSAGGHLAALISTDPQYFNNAGTGSPVKGTVLIDAAGLDMYGYMKDVDYGPGNSYLRIFGSKEDSWKAASPLFHIGRGLPEMLIYQGGRTYPSIASSNRKFVRALEGAGYHPRYQVLKGKKHIPMITQFFNTRNKRYREIKMFMEKP